MKFLEITKQLKAEAQKEIDRLIKLRNSNNSDMTDISCINDDIKILQEMLDYNEWGNIFDHLHSAHYIDRLKKNDQQYEKDCLGYEPKNWVA